MLYPQGPRHAGSKRQAQHHNWIHQEQPSPSRAARQPHKQSKRLHARPVQPVQTPQKELASKSRGESTAMGPSHRPGPVHACAVQCRVLSVVQVSLMGVHPTGGLSGFYVKAASDTPSLTQPSVRLVLAGSHLGRSFPPSGASHPQSASPRAEPQATVASITASPHNRAAPTAWSSCCWLLRSSRRHAEAPSRQRGASLPACSVARPPRARRRPSRRVQLLATRRD